MRSFSKRFYFVITVTLAAALLAALGGSALARYLVAQKALQALDEYAIRLVSDNEASSSELRSVLAAINASRQNPCSEADLEMLGRIIFESDYLRDAGRMQGDQLLCSVQQGRLAKPATIHRAFYLHDGASFYTTPEMSQNGELALRSGDAYLVFTPITRLHLESGPMYFMETALNAPDQQAHYLQGARRNISQEILRTEGVYQVGGDLYATECSVRYFNCVTAYTTTAQMMLAYRSLSAGVITLSALLGAALGFAFSWAYRRNKCMAQQLRRSIAQDKLRVVYQPIVDLKTRRITGAESLARWNNEEGLEISPEVFIQVAEENGFVGEITRLVVRHALRDHLHALRNDPDFRIGVNIAPSDLGDPAFLPFLEEALHAADVAPEKLAIEITESSTAQQAIAKEAIAQLRQKGHPVNIDDFGTGYSSLSYLHDLDATALKIDKSFTQAIGTGSVIVSILPQILSMARTLGLHVIVEGVETEEQAEYFAKQGDEILAQGWLFGRPQQIAFFCATLAADRSGHAAVPAPALSKARAKA